MKTKILAILLGLAVAVGGAARAQTPDELPAEGMPNLNPDVAPAPPPDEEPPQEEPRLPPDQPETGYTGGGDPAAPFREPLRNAGTWTQRAGSPVWVPKDEPGGWRPYTTGHWANTDEGWTWVADEDWGWAPFHYGRWFFDRELGWAWMPGSVWAPAWVAWRSGADYIGWAPLPPSVGFDATAGVETSAVDRIYADHYNFVSERSFLAPQVNAALIPSSQSATLFRRSYNTTRYSVNGSHIINQGVSVQRIERATGRPVPQLQISAAATRTAGRHSAAQPGRLLVYRPPSLSPTVRTTRAEFGMSRRQQPAGTAQSSRPSTRPSTPGGSNRQYDTHGDRSGWTGGTKTVPQPWRGNPSQPSGGRGTPSSGSADPRRSRTDPANGSERSRRPGSSSYGQDTSQRYRPPQSQRPPSSAPPHRTPPPPTRTQSQPSKPRPSDKSSSHRDQRPPA